MYPSNISTRHNIHMHIIYGASQLPHTKSTKKAEWTNIT